MDITTAFSNCGFISLFKKIACVHCEVQLKVTEVSLLCKIVYIMSTIDIQDVLPPRLN
jgi:hypothetical protein